MKARTVPKNCRTCNVLLVMGDNYNESLRRRRGKLCRPCKNRLEKESERYQAARKTTKKYASYSTELERRLSRKYNDVKQSAWDRGISFLVSMPDFIATAKTPCFYCDAASTAIKPNGLDRADSKKSYDLGNVRSCCAACNFGKNTMSDLEYVEHCRQVVVHTIKEAA